MRLRRKQRPFPSQWKIYKLNIYTESRLNQILTKSTDAFKDMDRVKEYQMKLEKKNTNFFDE